MPRLIFHIDVNSAFLSWSAVYRLEELGEEVDLRTIPSVVAEEGDIRRSIVLAKSTPAKKYGVKTGEPLGMAREKCPQLAGVCVMQSWLWLFPVACIRWIHWC